MFYSAQMQPFTNTYPVSGARQLTPEQNNQPLIGKPALQRANSFGERTRNALNLNADKKLHQMSDLNPQTLQNMGVRGVIFDLDDTLMKLPSGKITPEMIQTLKQLQAAGYKMGVVSNNPSEAYCKKAKDQLDAAGIDIPFIKGAGKPDPDSLETMSQHLGLPAEQVAMVGDSVLCDVRTGKKLGMKTIQVDWFQNSKTHKALIFTGDVLTTVYRSFTDPKKPLEVIT